MPSGVSHGSALPAGLAWAVFSNAIFAKSGMRLMASIIAHAWGWPSSIMVRMLVADDAVKLVRTVILQRGVAWQISNAHHPAKPGFGAELLGRYHPVRPVECAGHDLDPWSVDAAEA